MSWSIILDDDRTKKNKKQTYETKIIIIEEEVD